MVEREEKYIEQRESDNAEGRRVASGRGRGGESDNVEDEEVTLSNTEETSNWCCRAE
jgi:hypothetical protein